MIIDSSNHPPMTARLVSHLVTLQRPYDDYGLYYVNNLTAYRWCMFEKRYPVIAKIAAVFRWGPRIALGI